MSKGRSSFGLVVRIFLTFPILNSIAGGVEAAGGKDGAGFGSSSGLSSSSRICAGSGFSFLLFHVRFFVFLVFGSFSGLGSGSGSGSTSGSFGSGGDAGLASKNKNS